MDHSLYMSPSSLQYNMFLMGYMPQAPPPVPAFHTPHYMATWPPPTMAAAYNGRPTSQLGSELMKSSNGANSAELSLSDKSVSSENEARLSEESSGDKHVTMCIPREKDTDRTWINFLEHNYVRLPASRFLNRSKDHFKSPFCLSLDCVTEVALPKGADDLSKVHYQLCISFFDVTYKRFFGRTWIGPLLTAKEVKGQKPRLNYNQNIYFHTSLNDLNIVLVIEIAAVVNSDDGQQSKASCGWGMFRLFKYEGDMLDTTSNQPIQMQRIDVFGGSPRALLYMDDPIESNEHLHPIPGCQLCYTIRTHRNLQKIMHLLPENVLVGNNDIIPGLAEAPKDPKRPEVDNLKKPKCVRSMVCHLDNVSIHMMPNVDKFEEELCQLYNEDRINRDNKVADGTSVHVVERRLQVGVHNGWCYVDDPEVQQLLPEGVSNKKGASYKKGHQRTPSTSSLQSLGSGLVLRNRVPLRGMVEDPMYAVVFTLQYVVSEPVDADTRKLAASMARSQTNTITLRWAAWSPFTSSRSSDVTIEMVGGPSPLPDSVLVYKTPFTAMQEEKAAKLALGTISFSFLQDKKKSGIGLRTDSQLSVHSQPSMLRPGSMMSIQSEGGSSVLHELPTGGVMGRPPLPGRGRSGAHFLSPRSHGQFSIGGAESLMSSPRQSYVQTPLMTSPRQSYVQTPILSPGRLPQTIQSSPGIPQIVEPQQGYGYPPQPYQMVPQSTPNLPTNQTYGSMYNMGYVPPSPMGTFMQSQQPPRRMDSPDHELQEMQITPVHHPIIARTGPSKTSGQGLSRAAYARLYNAGFPPILDRYQEAPEVVDPTDHINFLLNAELNDHLQCNEIVFQFLAFSRANQTATSNKQHGTIFFTFQFYRFPQVTSERLLLGKVEGDLSACPQSFPSVLQKLNADGSVTSNAPGYQVKYHMDPSYMKAGEMQLFVQHMSKQTLHIDVWDGDSLLLIGSSAVELKHLCRQGREAVQVTYELDVVNHEFSEETSSLTGDAGRGGSVHPVGVSVSLQGRLHLRLANVGYPVEQKLHKSETMPLMKNRLVVSQNLTNKSSFLGGSLNAGAPGQKRSRVYRAHHVTEVNQELASILHSQSMTGQPMEESSKVNQDLDSQTRRKLARMEAVRKAQGSENLPRVQTFTSYKKEKTERTRDLKTIDLFRQQTKKVGILSMLSQAITTEYTVAPSMGSTEFFEFMLRNPYNVQHTIRIEWEDPELYVITDTREWRFFKNVNAITTPVEESMFNTQGTSEFPEIFLRPKETVNVPFKFLTLHADHSVPQQGPADPFRPHPVALHQDKKKELGLASRFIKVYFKTLEGKVISVLGVRVEPQPHIIDQTFRFHHPEQSFLKKSIRLPPFHALPGTNAGGPTYSQLYARCSDPNVICDSKPTQQGEPQDIFIKTACGASPQTKTFFVAIYSDPFLSKPIQIWQFYVHSLQRVDVSCIEGQTSRFSLILRGTQSSRLVKCFSSNPQEMQVEPNEQFMLTANTVHEIHVGVRPLHVGSKFLYINVVDVEYHQLIRNWLVCVKCTAPVVTKAFELKLPVGGGRGCNKRISYTNPYPYKKQFILHSNREDLLQFKDARLDIGAGESQVIGLRFAPSQAPGVIEILIFINDEDDKNEETFCVKAVYSEQS